VCSAWISIISGLPRTMLVSLIYAPKQTVRGVKPIQRNANNALKTLSLTFPTGTV